jgi:methylthioribose-1-phosphate isomerase
MSVDNLPKTIWWEQDRVRMVDQSRLPLVGDVLEVASYEGIMWAIGGMAVRGAPALGVATAMGMALFAVNEYDYLTDMEDFLTALDGVADEICDTRPTAANMRWAAERMRAVARENAEMDIADLRKRLVDEALAIAEEDEARNRAMGAHGAELLPDECQVLTHCNAGSLATYFYGTALGVVYAAHEAGKQVAVWVDETRPVLQGARLTAWELGMVGIPYKLIVDSAAGMAMTGGGIDAVIVGADRIAANGDVANKIGTYQLAVLAKTHDIPFYVVAPTSTIDLTMADGSKITIEQRDSREVAGTTFAAAIESLDPAAESAFRVLTVDGAVALDLGRGHELVVSSKDTGFQLDGWFRNAPLEADVFNPAFDVTPAEYVTAIVTENGVARPGFAETLPEVCEGAGSLADLVKGD